MSKLGQMYAIKGPHLALREPIILFPTLQQPVVAARTVTFNHLICL